MKRQFKKAVLSCFFVCGSFFAVNAQEGAYTGFTPYSVFGVGELNNSGNAYNKTMGGVGIAARNRKFINYMNPASITCRDTLSFMADVSVYHTSKIYTQEDTKSCTNATNINDLAMSFPIYKTLACVVGISPYSSSGYGFKSYEEDPYIVGKTGSISNITIGQGTINQLFFGVGAMFWNRLSVGAEYIHYFGDIERSNSITFSDDSYNGISSGYEIDVKGSTAKLGVQYVQPLGNNSLTFGATYTMKAKMKGSITDYQLSSGTVLTDTLRYEVEDLGNSESKSKFASELGLGVSFSHMDKLKIEFDYLRSDWTSCGLDKYGFKSVATNRVFAPSVNQSFRLGCELTPNANDIRYYFRRCSYRFGAYYNKEYYTINGDSMSSKGVTLGMTLPVFNLNNGLTLGVDLGERGRLDNALIRENYFTFNIGVNIYDIWFVKHQYQ